MTAPAPIYRFGVKGSLTPKQPQRPVENDEYAAFLGRVIRAYSRRVACGDIDAITAMTNLTGELDHAITQAITGLRGHGYSWAEIAVRLGITRQAAQQRWGHQPPERPPHGNYGPDPQGHDGPDCQCPYCPVPDENLDGTGIPDTPPSVTASTGTPIPGSRP